MTTKRYGPYRGSKANGGRPIYVYKTTHSDGSVTTSSSNKARVEYEESMGKKLPKGTDVNHKNEKGREGDDRLSNLNAVSKRENVAKRNRDEAKKVAKKPIKKAVKKKP